MKLEIGMKVYVHSDNEPEARENRSHGVQDEVVTITGVFDTHIIAEQERPELGEYRHHTISIPLRRIKYIVYEQ